MICHWCGKDFTDDWNDHLQEELLRLVLHPPRRSLFLVKTIGRNFFSRDLQAAKNFLIDNGGNLYLCFRHKKTYKILIHFFGFPKSPYLPMRNYPSERTIYTVKVLGKTRFFDREFKWAKEYWDDCGGQLYACFRKGKTYKILMAEKAVNYDAFKIK